MTTNEKASSVRGTLYDVKGTCLICGTELNSK